MQQVETSVDIPIAEIHISPYHFRKETLQEGLEGLAESMSELGQIHSVSVVRSPNGGYELANGHRRLLATRDFNKQATIRADVYEFTDAELEDEQEQQKAVSQFLLAANQTEPLVPLERARFYQDVMEKFGWELDRISKFYGIPKADILRDLKYLNISPKVLAIVADHPEKISAEHLNLLAEWSSPEKKGWRLDEHAQIALVDGLVKQTDKPAAEDPKEFERTIKTLKAEERRRKSQRNKAERQRQPVQVIKDVVRALEGVSNSVNTLARIDIPKDTPVELVDKREIIDQCYAMAQGLTEFADAKIGALPLKRAVETANA